MKKLQWIIRISLLLIIVLLGLTIIAPEWLELKDAFFTPKPTYEDPNAYKQEWSYRLSAFFSSITDNIADIIIRIINAPAKLLSGIHHIILGSPGPSPTGFVNPILGLLSFTWTIIAYGFFIAFTLLLSHFSNNFIKKLTAKYNKLNQVSLKFPFLFKLTSAIVIFSLALLIWWLVWSFTSPGL